MPLPLADLGSVVLARMGEDVELEERAAGSYGADGLAVRGALTTTTIRAAFLPTTGEQLRKVPEGERTEETRAIYTARALWASREGSNRESDRIVRGGQTYRVVHVEDYVAVARYALALGVRVTP